LLHFEKFWKSWAICWHGKSSGRGEKRKALNDELEELKNEKRCLLKDVDAMTASANEYAEKTEKTHQLTWIAKSNSFRRSAKEKTSELKVFDEQLTAKLLQLKNCAWTACPWLRHV